MLPRRETIRALSMVRHPQAKRARAEEANAKLAEAAELTLERARTREAQHSYVLQQRREAREREEAERREREQAAKKEALLKEERRAKAAMEMLLVRAKKDATDELAVIKSLPGGAAKSTRIRKLRAKYHPDRNLPGKEVPTAGYPHSRMWALAS